MLRALNGLVMRSSLSREARLAVFRTVYRPILTYGHEQWAMTAKVRSRVQAAEMRFLRRTAGVSLRDHIHSSTIRQELNVEPLLLTVEKSQLRWLGHVLRQPEERLVRQALIADVQGKRPRGRPRSTWLNTMRQIVTGRCDIPWEFVEEVASNRTIWRNFVNSLIPLP